MFESKEPAYLELQDIDSIDIELFLPKLEQSLEFTFGSDETLKILTFGDLCDHIVHKLEEKATKDCTSQQAFYRIRKAIKDAQLYDAALSTDTSLEEIFPRKHRYQLIKNFETKLGFKVQLLQQRPWLLLLSRLALLVSIVTLFCVFLKGLAGVIVSLLGISLSRLPRKKLTVKTVGQLAKKIAKENYNDVRRTPAVVNEEEIVQKIKEMFIKEFELHESSLTRDAPFN
ncbi:hypothetical protein [Chitinophaga sancti]|uniref:Uncharacterized protein n=1 Tax=Chitinophaga sancti TaxID=1004 RepID=A0A1K1NYT5_9BACT|nr:hypothetical protein [Chitinophaga sancti]WQD60315.1 hypothetical protein U0033_20700 [Chitinophaga sancti]WQG87557.1 hypothetical protein SR876_21770 [Chitinophaga sancti]SFW40495.1 hypothetical protein SAMN05661012_01614 [Chitinophaga sancti]